MRNLKKILALVLALVMSMSLVVTANAFEDTADVDETFAEAVEVLTNLGVFKGRTETEFAPKASITRAEVAAIIYRIVTGDVTDKQVGIYADYNKFDDVTSDKWFAGYVNYCANAQYINGYGNGKFGPNDPVTGYQALAMILRAIGYDKNGEFSGAGWQVQTAAVANQRGITQNVSAGLLGQAATRETVAEILFQTILVPQVTYTVAFGYQWKNGLGLDDDENESLGEQSFDLKCSVGEITAVDYEKGTTTLSYKIDAAKNSVKVVDSVIAECETSWENIGYEAYVYTVPGAKKTAVAVSKAHITGTSLAESTDGTVYDSNTVASLIGKGAIVDIEDHEDYLDNPKTNAKDDGSIKIYYNGEDVTWTADAVKALNAIDKRGVKADFIDNDGDNYAEIVAITEYTPARVTGIAGESNTGLNAITKDHTYFDQKKIANEKIVCADELAYQDIVTYVTYRGYTYVTLANVADGDYTDANFNKTTRSYDSYVIGGETYNVSEVSNGYQNSAENFLQARDEADRKFVNLGKNVTVATDPYGYILVVGENIAAKDYLFVVRHNHSNNVEGTVYATVAYGDGTLEKVYLNNKDIEKFGAIESHIYSYTDKGEYYKLSASETCDSTCVAKNVNYVNGSATMTDGANEIFVNKASVVVDLRKVMTRDADEAVVYTGYKEIPSLTDATIHYMTDVNGFITLAFLTAGDNTADLSREFVVYTTDYHRYNAADEAYWLSVIADGEIKDVKLDEDEYADVCEYGVGIYTYNKKGELEYTAFNEDWYDVVWYNAALGIKDEVTGETVAAYTYDDENVKFFTMDINEGKAWSYAMDRGYDQQESTIDSKAVLVTDKGAVKTIYIVYGELATKADRDWHSASQNKDGGTWNYIVNNTLNRITNGEFTPGATYDTARPTVYVTETMGTDNVIQSNYFHKIVLSYADFLEYVDEDGNLDLTVVPANGNKVSVKTTIEWGTFGENRNFTLTGVNDTTPVTFNVLSKGNQVTPVEAAIEEYAFTVEVNADTYGTDLWVNPAVVDAVGNVTNGLPVAPAVFDGTTVPNITIKEMTEKYFGHNGYDIEWKLFSNADNLFDEGDTASTKTLSYGLVKVIAQDGSEDIYVIDFSNAISAKGLENIARILRGWGFDDEIDIATVLLNAASVNNDVMTALANEGATAQDIFRIWSAKGWFVLNGEETLVPQMLNHYTGEEIVKGYMSYWAAQPAGSQVDLAGSVLSETANGFTLAVDGGGSHAMLNNLSQVATAAGYNIATAHFYWTNLTEGGSYNGNASTWGGTAWPAITAAVQTGIEYSMYMTVENALDSTDVLTLPTITIVKK